MGCRHPDVGVSCQPGHGVRATLLAATSARATVRRLSPAQHEQDSTSPLFSTGDWMFHCEKCTGLSRSPRGSIPCREHDCHCDHARRAVHGKQADCFEDEALVHGGRHPEHDRRCEHEGRVRDTRFRVMIPASCGCVFPPPLLWPGPRRKDANKTSPRLMTTHPSQRSTFRRRCCQSPGIPPARDSRRPTLALPSRIHRSGRLPPPLSGLPLGESMGLEPAPTEARRSPG